LSGAEIIASRQGRSDADLRQATTVDEAPPVVYDPTTSDELGLPPPWKTVEQPPPPRAGFWRRRGLFLVSVVLPMAIAAVLMCGILAPRYTSSATFIVRSTDQTAQAQVASATDAAGSILINDETYAINAYLISRDMIDKLTKNDKLLEILSRPQADFIFRFPTFWSRNNKETLYRRFQWMVSAEINDTTGMSTIEVNAFTPHDAQAIAQAMLHYAEDFVNRLNDRFYENQVATADRFVDEAQLEVDKLEAELKSFRNSSGSLDPTLVAKSQLDVIEGLSGQLAQVDATIAQQLKLARATPALNGLRAQARSYRDEIEKQKHEVAGGSQSEAVKLQTYDLLTLRRDLAEQALADAVEQRELARYQVERQHLYVQVISQPQLALDWARYPRVTFDLLALLAICLASYQVCRLLGKSTAEHHP
jgi:capsular polysaccharide transport system permease protein